MKYSLKLKLKISSLLGLSFLIIYMLKPVEAQAPIQAPAPQQIPQTQTSTTEVSPPNQNVYSDFAPGVPQNISTLTQGAFIGMLSSASCLLAGTDPLQAEGKCLVPDQKTGLMVYAKPTDSGIATLMGRLIGGTMNIPISGSDYAMYMAGNFGITERAHAQENGLGFDRLRPLINIWTRFRDIAYLVFVLAFTIIGFAIILRVKIDARTVMTIQNQIPKIVIALVLVTFSYAIAGFMIDLMYVAIFLIILTFTSISPVNFNPETTLFSVINSAFNTGWPAIIPNTGGFQAGDKAVGSIFSSGIFNITWTVSRTIAGVFTSLTTDLISSTIGSLFQTFFIPFKVISSIGCGAVNIIGTGGLGLIGYIPGVGDAFKAIPGIGGLFGGTSCDFVETFFRGFITTVFTLLAFVVVLIAIIFNLFRAWITMIKSFMYVLVDTMVAPLWIGAGILPGSKLNFTGWAKHLAGHLSVFPTAFAVILLAKTMMDAIESGGTFFSPPLIGDALGGNSSVAAFVGFGFILSLPGIIDRVRASVGAISFGLNDIKTGFGVGRELGQKGIGSVVNPGTRFQNGQIQEMGTVRSFASKMFGL